MKHCKNNDNKRENKVGAIHFLNTYLSKNSADLGRYGRTISEAPYDSESEIETAMEQEADLENWARHSDYWHEDPHAYFKELGYKFYGYGGEAQVYTEGDGYVHKICRTGQYDNLIRLIDRITLQGRFR